MEKKVNVDVKRLDVWEDGSEIIYVATYNEECSYCDIIGKGRGRTEEQAIRNARIRYNELCHRESNQMNHLL